MELTGIEKQVLSGISFNADDIESGNLNADEEAMLLEMRSVADYLNEKYPSTPVIITGCDPKSGTVKTYNEWYFRPDAEAGGENLADVCSAIVEAASPQTSPQESSESTTDTESCALSIRDNFYGTLVRGPMEKNISSILTDSDLPVIDIDVSFWEHLGKEYGEQISVEDVLSAVVPAGNDIKIFLDGSMLSGSPYDSTVAKVKTCLNEAGVKGDIYIVILRDAESDKARGRLFTKSLTLD